ncbi:MAG: peptidoglycan DD-metalloendopeptidase family protein [Blastocatellia bacterium]
MSLTEKRVIILLALALIIMGGLALLLAIFQLAFYAQRGAAPASPALPEARNSPRASPVIGQSPMAPMSPTAPSLPSPPVGHETPENGGAARPVETVALIEPGALTIPVAGVRPEQLRDTYSESRSEGRAHHALDIMASCGAPVVAALPGKIIKLFRSDRGGVTIYQMGADNQTVYYYAHLARYADGLAEGHLARQGEVIGYVGDTGNVVRGACHLHFAIWSVTDPKRYWEGENINPYPLLRP